MNNLHRELAPISDAAWAQTARVGLDAAVVAELRGWLEGELSLSGENASIAFSATQPETRTAIEQSLPILRNMLSEHGLALAQASVNGGAADPSGGGQPQRGAGDFAPSSGHARATGGPAAGSEPIVRAPRAARGLLDLFA